MQASVHSSKCARCRLGAVEAVAFPLTLPCAAARQAQAEIDRVLDGRPLPALGDVAALGYVMRCVNESMRLYPHPPVLLRRAQAPDVLPGRVSLPALSLAQGGLLLYECRVEEANCRTSPAERSVLVHAYCLSTKGRFSGASVRNSAYRLPQRPSVPSAVRVGAGCGGPNATTLSTT